jgi:hypothetical protein
MKRVLFHIPNMEPDPDPFRIRYPDENYRQKWMQTLIPEPLVRPVRPFNVPRIWL